MKRFVLVALIALIPVQAWAWGASGHRLVSRLAVEVLPKDIPAFVRTPEAVEAIGEFGREPDRSRVDLSPHTSDFDAGHFLDADDEGKAMGGPAIGSLPMTRDQYETALRAAGTTSLKAGWLPYEIVDGYQQLVIDFAYWRVLRLGETRGATPAERAWYKQDRIRREALTLRDLGEWSHFVGDGSQPLHVSLHYNGWGSFPNPKGYTQEHVHAPFEGAFVKAYVTEDAVRAALRPAADCGTIQICTAALLSGSWSKVEPLYQLWGQGGFKDGDPRGRAFAAERLGAGVSMLRDLIVKAWAESDTIKIGYPAVGVKAVEAGGPLPFESFHGRD